MSRKTLEAVIALALAGWLAVQHDHGQHRHEEPRLTIIAPGRAHA